MDITLTARNKGLFQSAFKVPAFLMLVFNASTSLFAQSDDSMVQTLTIGGHFSNGDYGLDEKDTKTLFLPISYELARFPWVVSMTVPYLQIDGPADIFPETGITGTTVSRRRVRSRDRMRRDNNESEKGIGDITLQASYQLPPVLNNLAYLDLTVEWKIPTADESRRLGTGEHDFSYQFDFYNTLGSISWFSTLGYRQRGKTSLYDLENSAYFSLGLAKQLAGGTNIGLIYDYREASTLDSAQTHEFMPYISWNMGPAWTVMLYTALGTTDNSADAALGLQFSYTFP